jgi:hypothetical protein
MRERCIRINIGYYFVVAYESSRGVPGTARG